MLILPLLFMFSNTEITVPWHLQKDFFFSNPKITNFEKGMLTMSSNTFFPSAAVHTNQNVLISGDCNLVVWILNFRYWSIHYSHHLWWISKSVDVEWNSILQELEDWNFMSSSQFNSGIKYMYVFGWGTLIYHSI